MRKILLAAIFVLSGCSSFRSPESLTQEALDSCFIPNEQNGWSLLSVPPTNAEELKKLANLEPNHTLSSAATSKFGFPIQMAGYFSASLAHLVNSQPFAAVLRRNFKKHPKAGSILVGMFPSATQRGSNEQRQDA